MILSKYIGDKNFYKKVLSLAVPIMIQNGISNFVNMLDNIMVGRVGTEQMTSVAIVNQILFVFNLCVFGAIAGIGIFTAQYFGKGDNEGIKNAFRLKLYVTLTIVLFSFCLFAFYGDNLITAYLHNSTELGNIDLDLVFSHSKNYLLIMMTGLIPFALAQSYAGTLRQVEKPLIPMISGLIAVSVNLIFNYLLIYGKFGFPKLGVEGAAIATAFSRIVECLIIISVTHSKKANNQFIKGVYKKLSVPFSTVKMILPKAFPLLINETFWALGMALLLNCYSLRGTSVVSAANICSTVTNIFIVAIIAFGDSIAIMAGGLLGAGKVQQAKDTARKLIVFSFGVCVVLGILMALSSKAYPMIYNTTDDIRSLASSFIICQAFYLPLNSIINSCYFAIRSGGKTLITFLFDSVYMLGVVVALTFVVAKYTTLSVIGVYAFSLGLEVFKAIIGLILVKKGTWAQNLVVKSEV